MKDRSGAVALVTSAGVVTALVALWTWRRRYGRQDQYLFLQFYKYVDPEWSEERRSQVLKWFEDNCCSLGIKGRMRVAREGLNGSLSGVYPSILKLRDGLVASFPELASTDFKLVDAPPEALDRKLRVWSAASVVELGVNAEEMVASTGQHLSAADFHKALQDPDVVVCDIRNAYETRVGRFETEGKFLDPGTRHFTDTIEWLQQDSTREQLAGKKILMYCTGGVRCERTTQFLKSRGSEFQEVYQLQGGIHRYLEAFPDGGAFKGKNYVFDRRKLAGPDTAEVLGSCLVCSTPWETLPDKPRRCSICEMPVLVCTLCLRKTDPKTGLKLECELCKPSSS
eukprot:CAMPEP_0204316800 /NCGR_PEP_ID=MMETSP0469-20131031/5601_1 /ASSEMBLY_ACC=CAM_ASM_000384 /TAXON_ID=2969 /ORGANISM="Oxyrrhis marina" /LENGTH=339 /DNA_ID=CAMNT_0051297623 /DNA_START=13 /DNA_END=1029 /DNA_ORIENTATION=+